MPCSQDLEDYRCQARCGELMACCGKSCNTSCDECQSLNDTLTDGGAIKRTKHTRHPCQKRLYCEHTCQEVCSESHEHTTHCKANCGQVCPHSRCRNQCSVPCAPCKQPCTWYVVVLLYSVLLLKNDCRSCTHYSCPIPCGSVSDSLGVSSKLN